MPESEAFERQLVRLPLSQIFSHRNVGTRTRHGRKYSQIANSLRTVGLIEPLVVARLPTGKFLIVDGLLRLEILREAGAIEADCLLAKDDEAFTYNKRVSRLSVVQEHNMILKALERGVSEPRLAESLSISPSTLRQKSNLLTGICGEVAEMLKDRHVPINLFKVLKKMVPTRQIDAVRLMIAVDKFTVPYARSLLAASPPADLRERAKSKGLKGVRPHQIRMIERESANLEREHQAAQRSFAQRTLNLVIAKGYTARLIANGNVYRYIALHHPDLSAQLQGAQQPSNTV
ncbi:MAG: plasmid partitioning protein RepB C-terminal domain-containing protein [Sphingomonadales bacterium]